MRLLLLSLITLLISGATTDKPKSGVTSPVAQEQKPLFSFGLIADVQYCNCDPDGTRFYRKSISKLEEAITSFRIDSPAFIINLGDLIDKDFNSFKPVMSMFDTAGFKIYHVTGNHDYSVEPRQKKRIPTLAPSKEGYFSFVYDNFRFIILNGNEISTYYSSGKKNIKKATDYIAKLKNEGEINAVDRNGGMSDKQILWLSNQLNASSKNNEKVFIMCHFPIFPENDHNLFNYRDILTVLGDYNNVIAWFAGHNHAGNYGNFNMIHFVTIKGMVETDDSNSFALVEVYKNKIWIKGSGREKSQILAY